MSDMETKTCALECLSSKGYAFQNCESQGDGEALDPLQHAGVVVVPHGNLLVGGAANLDTDIRDVGVLINYGALRTLQSF